MSLGGRFLLGKVWPVYQGDLEKSVPLALLVCLKCSRPSWMGLEQSALVEAVPAYDRDLEPDDPEGPFQLKPFFPSITSRQLGNLNRGRRQRICLHPEIPSN